MEWKWKQGHVSNMDGKWQVVEWISSVWIETMVQMNCGVLHVQFELFMCGFGSCFIVFWLFCWYNLQELLPSCVLYFILFVFDGFCVWSVHWMFSFFCCFCCYLTNKIFCVLCEKFWCIVLKFFGKKILKRAQLSWVPVVSNNQYRQHPQGSG